ncbi:aspartate 1-decarboxylase [Gleimia hominis]|uniref:Aspartate 1-decarboxylase n=1 Tax=Gleimia hominis TaxID=595468 RepID=A0ABU3IDJ6_9ACTO|nr:aspartate 1-decarboxylase [Gleimia hominis]MDT3768036.1 aspartate 1-decarboxylase [Gleimia hominis]
MAEVYRTLMSGKIHRATVTSADLHYVGSITIDSDLLEAAGIVEGEKVDVVSVTSGARLSTYAIAGQPGSGGIQVNGAAAHLINKGEVVIIIAYAQVPQSQLEGWRGRVVLVDERNRQIHVGDDPASVPAGLENATGGEGPLRSPLR